MLKHKLLYISLFIFSLSAEECEDRIENHLGTKSPYRFVANKNYTKDTNLQGCITKIWMLTRHGTRNPNAREIQKIQAYLPILKDIILERNSDVFNSNLVKSDIELFEKWQPRVEVKGEKKLTTEGELEMLELAERMQARFPDILPPIYSNTSYKFKFTKTQRTKRSAQAFAVGLFDKRTAKDVYFPDAVKPDPILRFYKLCSKWSSSVKKNATTYDERKKFIESQIMKNALEKVTKKLRLDNPLSFDDAHLMYTTCAFETSWSSKRKSPWCVPFDLDVVKVMEYAEDLKYYWVDGYGSEITYKQACRVFNDMLNFMIDENPYPKAVFYFSHSGTLLKMISHLGLYKDDKPLVANDYDKNHRRKWRISKIDSFGSNLAFIRYRCNNDNKIMVLHNEMPIRLPSCPDSDLCDLKRIKQYYLDSIDQCAFDSICENSIST